MWFYILSLTFAFRYSTWLFGITLFPFFMNENTEDFYWYIYYPCLVLTTVAGVASNVFFTYRFLVTLYKVNILRTTRVPKASQLFMFKCCIHCLSRCELTFFQYFSTLIIYCSTLPSLVVIVPSVPLPESLMIVFVFVTCSTHIIFNCDIDHRYALQMLRFSESHIRRRSLAAAQRRASLDEMDHNLMAEHGAEVKIDGDGAEIKSISVRESRG
jgi:hypothetical protein